MLNPMNRGVRDLAAAWLARAAELEAYAPPAAEAFRRASAELLAAIDQADHEALTLEEAALASGFSRDHLRHLVAGGQIPNAGKRGAPRIRRRDLPRKPSSTSSYDPNADALQLVNRSWADRKNRGV